MSRICFRLPVNIGTVVEGPTDRLVLEAMITHILPGKHRFFRLQPMETFGETGTGWKGVRKWCRDTWRREGNRLEKILSQSTGPALDLLIIQVDADIAGEWDLLNEDRSSPEIQKPCPPVENTAVCLRQVIKEWLNRETLPAGVLLTLPAQDIEHWIFAALFPEDECCCRDDYECSKREKESPAYLFSLSQYGKLTSRKSGKIKKHVRSYQKITHQISVNIDHIARICTQGRRFIEELKSFMSRHIY